MPTEKNDSGVYFTRLNRPPPYKWMTLYRLNRGEPESMKGVIYGENKEQAIKNLLELTGARGYLEYEHGYQKRNRIYGPFGRRYSVSTDYVDIVALWFEADVTSDFEYFVSTLLRNSSESLSWVSGRKNAIDTRNAFTNLLRLVYSKRYAVLDAPGMTIVADLETGFCRNIVFGPMCVHLPKINKALGLFNPKGSPYDPDNWLAWQDAYRTHHKQHLLQKSYVCVDMKMMEVIAGVDLHAWFSCGENFSRNTSDALVPVFARAMRYAAKKARPLVQAGVLEDSPEMCDEVESMDDEQLVGNSHKLLYELVEMDLDVIRKFIKVTRWKRKLPISQRTMFELISSRLYPNRPNNSVYCVERVVSDAKVVDHPLFRYAIPDRDYLAREARMTKKPELLKEFDMIMEQRSTYDKEEEEHVG